MPGATADTLKDATVTRCSARSPAADPGRLRARPVRRLPRHRPAWSRTRPPRRTRRSAWTIENWRWSGVPFFIRTGKRLRGHADRGAAGVRAPAAGSGFAPLRDAQPEPDQIVDQARPDDRRAASARGACAPTRSAPSRSTWTWSSRSRGRRGPDPVRGAAARGDGRAIGTRVHPPGRGGGDAGGSCSRCWTSHRRSIRTPRGSWGPAEADELLAGYGRWHEPWVAHERERTPATERRGPLAVPADRRLRVPLRLPHRGADRTRTGRSTGCACPPSTRPASFGSLLDREAGRFRLGPNGINVPTARGVRAGHQRRCSPPGARRPAGSRCATRSPSARASARNGHAAHPAADRRGRRPHARAHGRVPRGRGGGRARLRAGVRLRPRAGDLDARARRRHRTWPTRAAPARRSGLRTDLHLGIEGNRVRARHVLDRGDRAFCSLSWAEDLRPPSDVDDAERRARRHRAFWRRWLGRRADPRPPLARPDPALGARDQGPDLHADRRDRRGAHHLAARDARRRAQLGLPLHLDARHDLHAAGAALS